MIFLESDFSVKILSVQKLQWDYNDTYVHPRPYNAISFRLKGNSTFSDGKNSITLSTGDILFMPKGVGYHLKSKYEEIIVIHFELEGLQQDYFEVIHPKHIKNYENLFQTIYSIWTMREQGFYLKTMSYLYALFARFTNHLAITENASYLKIKKSVEFINQNFTDCNLNINVLCQISNISDTYFRRLFYEIFETTPIKFINQLRINYAIELIETGYYSVEQIAERCGFEDPKYFSTSFKKETGFSPSKYAKKSNTFT